MYTISLDKKFKRYAIIKFLKRILALLKNHRVPTFFLVVNMNSGNKISSFTKNLYHHLIEDIRSYTQYVENNNKLSDEQLREYIDNFNHNVIVGFFF